MTETRELLRKLAQRLNNRAARFAIHSDPDSRILASTLEAIAAEIKAMLDEEDWKGPFVPHHFAPPRNP